MFLPFEYSEAGQDRDPNGSLTFPSLLSFKFDFVPDNFSGFHPAYIFQAEPASREIKGSDTAGLTDFITRWNATHAIGGRVFGENGLYSGNVFAVDSKGTRVFEAAFDAPVPYFTLMGQMTEAWLAFRGQPVTEALRTELRRPMTAKAEIVRKFGEVFTVERYSQAEWKVYEEVLEEDPDFAEVRFWYANQKQWTTGDAKDGADGRAQAVQKRIVINAFEELNPTEVTKPAYLTTARRVLSQAENLPLHPKIQAARLSLDGKTMSVAQLRGCLSRIEPTPLSFVVLNELSYQFQSRDYHDKAIPLYLSILRSGYFASERRYDEYYEKLSRSFWELGMYQEGTAMAAKGLEVARTDTYPWLAWDLALNLRELFQFKDAAALFLERFQRHGDRFSLLLGMCSLYQGGLVKEAEQWEREGRLKKVHAEIAPTLKLRKLLAEGKWREGKAAAEALEATAAKDPWIRVEELHALADYYDAAGLPLEALRAAEAALRINPLSRRTAYLYLRAAAAAGRQNPYAARVLGFLGEEAWFAPEALQTSRTESSAQGVLSLLSILPEGLLSPSFWKSQAPWFPEYAALTLADQGKIEQALGLYASYMASFDKPGEMQHTHLRSFYLRLLQGLPASRDRASWEKRID